MAFKRILIADDDPGVIERLVGYLKDRSYKMQTVENGPEALDLILRGSFDLVVVGLEMPVLNGLEILRKIRLNKFETPVVILSRHGSLMQALDVMRLGAKDFLHKPVRSENFLKTVDNILEFSLHQSGGRGEKGGILRQDRIQNLERLGQSMAVR